MVDSSYDACGWINPSLAHMVNDNASSKIVTGYAVRSSYSRDTRPFKDTLVTGTD
jgi:hypothetical protein